nr:hypothetical protein A6C57_25600 [Fibrella sp. ES10-3-2-2]
MAKEKTSISLAEGHCLYRHFCVATNFLPTDLHIMRGSHSAPYQANGRVLSNVDLSYYMGSKK